MYHAFINFGKLFQSWIKNEQKPQFMIVSTYWKCKHYFHKFFHPILLFHTIRLHIYLDSIFHPICLFHTIPLLDSLEYIQLHKKWRFWFYFVKSFNLWAYTPNCTKKWRFWLYSVKSFKFFACTLNCTKKQKYWLHSVKSFQVCANMLNCTKNEGFEHSSSVLR